MLPQLKPRAFRVNAACLQRQNSCASRARAVCLKGQSRVPAGPKARPIPAWGNAPGPRNLRNQSAEGATYKFNN